MYASKPHTQSPNTQIYAYKIYRSDKKRYQNALLSMGFQETYIIRAFKVYEKNYGTAYNVEVITEIIVRLQNKDKLKYHKEGGSKQKKKREKAAKIAEAAPAAPAAADDTHKKPKYKNISPKKKSKRKDSTGIKPSAVDNGGSEEVIEINASKDEDHPPAAFSNIQSQVVIPQQQNSMPTDTDMVNNINSIDSSGYPSAPSAAAAAAAKNMQPFGFQVAQQINTAAVLPKNMNAMNMNINMNMNNMPMNMQGMNNVQMNNMMNIYQQQSSNYAQQQPMQVQSQPMQVQSQPMQVQQQPMQVQQSSGIVSAPAYIQNNAQVQQQIMQELPPQPQVQVVKPPPLQQRTQPPPLQQHSKFMVDAKIVFKDEFNKIQNGQIMKIRNGKCEISYPLNSRIFERRRIWLRFDEIQNVSQSQPVVQNNNQRVKPPPPSKTSKINILHGNQFQPQFNTHAHSKSQTTVNIHHTTDAKPKSPSNSTLSRNTSTGSTGVPPFEDHMPFEDADKLRLHDKIDHRDQVGRFVFATIVEKQGTNLKIHYDGWSRKWDAWSDYALESNKFAKPGSISKRVSHRFRQLKKGDYVDLNPVLRHPGWKCGEIRRLDQKSGQVQVVYDCHQKNYLYWAHLDNEHEIAQFTTKSGTDHKVQKEMESKIVVKHDDWQQKKVQSYSSSQQQQFGQFSGYQQQNVMGGGGQQWQQMSSQQQPSSSAPYDEMEQFRRIREKRFPLLTPDEEIDNPYNAGDWLEVQDTQTQSWVTASVIDKENNWIVVHFDGWTSKYDQKIHCMKHQSRLRQLGSGLQQTKEELEIKEEMDNFLREVHNQSWQLRVVNADGNCLYRCFAIEIYNETEQHMDVRNECCKYMRENKKFFQNFIPDFESCLAQKEQLFEWGDHVDITALSELYNVRVRVFEYSKQDKKLYMSFDQGEYEKTVNLPLILLARHRKKHYNVIIDGKAVHSRPLGTSAQRSDSVSLRNLRLAEDAVDKMNEENKDNDDEHVDDDDGSGNNYNNNNNNDGKKVGFDNNLQHMSSIIVRSVGHKEQFDIHLNESDFMDVMEVWNLSEPLEKEELQNAFQPLVKKLQCKVEAEWDSNHCSIDKNILHRSWEGQFNSNMSRKNCHKWVKALKEKVPSGKFSMNVCLLTFNQIIADMISSNLGSVVMSERRKSQYDTNSMEIDR